MSSGTNRNRIRILGIGIILLAGVLPVVLYWAVIGNAPSLDVPAAKSLLNKAKAAVALVDVREPEEFSQSHIENAVNWPYDAIQTIESVDKIPTGLKDKTMLFICDSGILSALAARKIEGIASQPVYSVRGGMQEWISVDKVPCPVGFSRLIAAGGTLEDFPMRRMSLFSQWAASIAAFGIKPTYMLLSLALAIVLRKSKAADLVALRRGLIFFFLGEGFCAVNYLFFHEDSYLVEYLHMFGMVLTFGFATYAIIRGLDLRVLKHGDKAKKCAALDLCVECYKYKEVNCNVRTVFLFFVPFMIMLCFLPLLAVPHGDFYNAQILGVAYNYAHPVIFQLYEIYYAPATAVVFFLLAFLFLLKTPVTVPDTTEVLFSAGMGLFGFSMLRFVLFAVYRENLWWFVIWEEVTELLFILGTGYLMWTFRRGLFRETR